jgi:hypothetical protein
MITLHGQSGIVVTDTLDTVPQPAGRFLPSEGFDTRDVNQPFYKAHLGQREVK